jgi:hypothetical protein
MNAASSRSMQCVGLLYQYSLCLLMKTLLCLEDKFRLKAAVQKMVAKKHVILARVKNNF